MTQTIEKEESAEMKKWQEYMDSAYSGYKVALGKNASWITEEFYDYVLANRPFHEYAAVLLGNYNYQVHNGGHAQWIDNGYAIAIHDNLKTTLFNILWQMEEDGVTHSTKVIELLRKAKREIKKGERYNEEKEQRYWGRDGSYEEYEFNFSKEDEKYYEIAEEFAESAAKWLVNKEQEYIIAQENITLFEAMVGNVVFVTKNDEDCILAKIFAAGDNITAHLSKENIEVRNGFGVLSETQLSDLKTKIKESWINPLYIEM